MRSLLPQETSLGLFVQVGGLCFCLCKLFGQLVDELVFVFLVEGFEFLFDFLAAGVGGPDLSGKFEIPPAIQRLYLLMRLYVGHLAFGNHPQPVERGDAVLTGRITYADGAFASARPTHQAVIGYKSKRASRTRHISCRATVRSVKHRRVRSARGHEQMLCSRQHITLRRYVDFLFPPKHSRPGVDCTQIRPLGRKEPRTKIRRITLDDHAGPYRPQRHDVGVAGQTIIFFDRSAPPDEPTVGAIKTIDHTVIGPGIHPLADNSRRKPDRSLRKKRPSHVTIACIQAIDLIVGRRTEVHAIGRNSNMISTVIIYRAMKSA